MRLFKIGFLLKVSIAWKFLAFGSTGGVHGGHRLNRLKKNLVPKSTDITIHNKWGNLARFAEKSLSGYKKLMAHQKNIGQITESNLKILPDSEKYKLSFQSKRFFFQFEACFYCFFFYFKRFSFFFQSQAILFYFFNADNEEISPESPKNQRGYK